MSTKKFSSFRQRGFTCNSCHSISICYEAIVASKCPSCGNNDFTVSWDQQVATSETINDNTKSGAV